MMGVTVFFCCFAGVRLKLHPNMPQATAVHSIMLSHTNHQILLFNQLTHVFNLHVRDGNGSREKKFCEKNWSMGFSHLYIQLSIYTLLARRGSQRAGVFLTRGWVSESRWCKKKPGAVSNHSPASGSVMEWKLFGVRKASDSRLHLCKFTFQVAQLHAQLLNASDQLIGSSLVLVWSCFS